MHNVRLVHKDIDLKKLSTDVDKVIHLTRNLNKKQISLTNLNGDKDWLSGIDDPKGKPYLYNNLNSFLSGSYIHELINRYSNYYRWRLLIMPPGQCYTIHHDRGDDRNLKRHFRLHIPVYSDPRCLMMFFNSLESIVSDRSSTDTYQMTPGNSYLFNANTIHTAINGSKSVHRIHMVGQRSM